MFYIFPAHSYARIGNSYETLCLFFICLLIMHRNRYTSVLFIIFDSIFDNIIQYLSYMFQTTRKLICIVSVIGNNLNVPVINLFVRQFKYVSDDIRNINRFMRKLHPTAFHFAVFDNVIHEIKKALRRFPHIVAHSFLEFCIFGILRCDINHTDNSVDRCSDIM